MEYYRPQRYLKLRDGEEYYEKYNTKLREKGTYKKGEKKVLGFSAGMIAESSIISEPFQLFPMKI